ncbi:MAG TPA: 4-hydroxy-tetrahydrodipicolinate reductase [Cyclobacteriaceae bacterium]|nr:4-hydroxy-tetrahydrodipicolinate reductase [Cyclobacteriaceae bacterium]
MKILLFGYGKMGKVIENIAVKRGHTIAGKIDPVAGLTFDFKTPVDVAIEFTTPESAVDNIKLCLDRGIPVLAGTTGWLAKKKDVDAYCLSKKGTFFYASNYSLGVNIFFKLNEKLAQMMKGQSAYSVHIDETHHTQKKDAPSGTAITLAEGVLKHLNTKKQWVNSETQQEDDLVIHSFRVDPAPGTHVITYTSPADDITIKHTAHSREGFALGAVQVAEWLPQQKGVLGMDQFLKF